MRLYLVQHGEATAEEVNPERPLTDKGKKDVTNIAQFLKSADITIDVIWHSTKLRAIETAQIFAQELLPKEGCEQKEGLAPNDPVNAVFANVLAKRKDAMIVGQQKITHLALLNLETAAIIKFNMAAVVCLEQNNQGKWQLIFAVPPNLLKN
jgi:phosphohistidine phosphatase